MEMFFIFAALIALVLIVYSAVKSSSNKRNRVSAATAIRETGFKSTATKMVQGYKIAVDESRKEWLVLPPDGNYKKIFRFDEIVSCDVDEVGDHNTMTGVYLRITTSDLNHSCIQIPVIHARALARAKYNKEGFVHSVAMSEARAAASFIGAVKAKATKT